MFSDRSRRDSPAPTSLRIPLDSSAIHPARNFIRSFAIHHGLTEGAAKGLTESSVALAEKLIALGRDIIFRGRLSIEIRDDPEFLQVDIRNRSLPVYPSEIEAKAGGIEADLVATLDQARTKVDLVEFANLGRRGQLFSFRSTKMPQKSAASPSSKNSVEIKKDRGSQTEQRDQGDLEFRDLKDGEEVDLARLVARVYGYRYINPIVYCPARLQEMRKRGDLRSRVAVLPNGKIAAHVGLIRLNTDPEVLDIALGLTDPRVPAKGVFSKLLGQVIDMAKETEMDYAALELVTNHDISQRLVSRFGSFDLNLSVGCQLSSYQAKLEKLGIGNDPKQTDRYSLLLGVLPQKDHVFGREVVLPIPLGETLGFLLTDLGIHWVPTPRFYPLATEGKYHRTFDDTQKAVYYDLEVPGLGALRTISEDWRLLRRQGYQYCAVDIPLNLPGTGQVFDHLTSFHFFVGGFVPYRFGNALALRMQSMGAIRVDFDEIVVSSERAKKLKQVVQASYERNMRK